MLRHQLEFVYSREQIRDAACAKADHHQERLSWWESELDNAATVLKTTGVEIREHDVSGGVRAEAVMDQAAQKRYSECRKKVRHHSDELYEYRRWIGALGTLTKGQSITFHYDDVEFFGL